LTPDSKSGNTIEPYFLHSGSGLILIVASVITPNVPEKQKHNLKIVMKNLQNKPGYGDFFPSNYEENVSKGRKMSTLFVLNINR